MEEDIKKVEELNDLLVGEARGIYSQSLENLLTSYKQLEEENKKMAEEYIVNNPGVARYLNENYIFKTKVKENLKQLEKEYKQDLESNSIEAFILKCKIEAIKELLGEE